MTTAAVGGNLKLIMLFQLLTRLITFLMNNFIARRSSATYLGLISMKLDLLGNTIMSLSRDGIRMALLRQKDRDERRKTGGLILISTALIGLICTGINLKLTTEPLILNVWPQYRQSVFFYFLAALLESFTEISTIELISTGRIKEKISIESAALIGRVSYILWAISGETKGSELIILLDSFSKGQMIYSLILNILHFRNQNLSFLLKFPSSQLINLCSSLTRQNFFKYFLSQGDLFVISSFSSLKDQGVYSVISNYGSLVLRLIMQPIEEASLQYFSKELNGTDENLQKVSAYFNLMLKTMIYLGLIFICFGSFFTDPVISLLLGPKWSSDTKAADALSAYCYLVAAAGISGFLESFVNAVIEENEMKLQRKISLISSLFYCLLAICLILWKGSVGLIVASSINFAIRAGANAFLIETYWKKKKGENSERKDSSDNIAEKDIRSSTWPTIPNACIFMFFSTFTVNFALFLTKRSDLKLRISIGLMLLSSNLLGFIKNDNQFLSDFKNHWMG